MSLAETTSYSFVSVEHLEEVTRGLGWETEYRQLKPGEFSSTVASLNGDSWFLMRESSSRTVEVQAPAPTGMYLFAIGVYQPGVINGQTMRSHHLFLQGPDSDFKATLPDNMQVNQVGILADEFEETANALFPSLSIPRECTRLIAAPQGRLTNVSQEIERTLTNPPQHAIKLNETVANIVSDIIAVIADNSSIPVDRGLHSAAGQRALARAREYIDYNLGETIRVASICEHVGTTQRSLERVFAREFGMTPQQYIKVRRLNAVHRSLLIADGDQDVSVTQVALRYGISHLGRFAADYRRYFGESPKETLQTHA